MTYEVQFDITPAEAARIEAAAAALAWMDGLGAYYVLPAGCAGWLGGWREAAAVRLCPPWARSRPFRGTLGARCSVPPQPRVRTQAHPVHVMKAWVVEGMGRGLDWVCARVCAPRSVGGGHA